MHRSRIRSLSLGVLAGVVLVAVLGAGGFPSRPKFQAVGVGQAAGATGTINGVAPSDWARLSGAPTFAGTVSSTADPATAPGFSSVASGGGRDAGFHVDSLQPSMAWRESDATADNRVWDCTANGELYTCRAIDDANSATGNWVEVNRTGTTIDSTNLLGTAVQVNGLALKPTVTCTTACSIANLPIGGSAYIGKGTATLRNSTTIDTADPDLQFTSTPAGTYSYEWFIPGTAGSASGLKGTVIGTSVTVDPLGMQICTGTGTVHSATSSPTGCVSNTGSAILSERGTATVSATTTMSVGWSQGTSTANNSTVPVSSWFRITRVK